VKAVILYQKKLNGSKNVPTSLKLNQAMEKKRKIIVRSFSLAKNIYNGGRGMHPSKQSELEVGAEFLEVSSQYTNPPLTIRSFPNLVNFQLTTCVLCPRVLAVKHSFNLRTREQIKADGSNS
jgi:hypothetical protein